MLWLLWSAGCTVQILVVKICCMDGHYQLTRQNRFWVRRETLAVPCLPPANRLCVWLWSTGYIEDGTNYISTLAIDNKMTFKGHIDTIRSKGSFRTDTIVSDYNTTVKEWKNGWGFHRPHFCNSGYKNKYQLRMRTTLFLCSRPVKNSFQLVLFFFSRFIIEFLESSAEVLLKL